MNIGTVGGRTKYKGQRANEFPSSGSPMRIRREDARGAAGARVRSEPTISNWFFPGPWSLFVEPFLT